MLYVKTNMWIHVLDTVRWIYIETLTTYVCVHALIHFTFTHAYLPPQTKTQTEKSEKRMP